MRRVPILDYTHDPQIASGWPASRLSATCRGEGWQPHSVRGFFAAVVRKKLGLRLESEKTDGGRVYRIVPAQLPPPNRVSAIPVDYLSGRTNSEVSPQNIPLKRRADFRRFSRIWQSETIRARAAKPGHTADAAVEVSLRDKQGGFEPVCIHHFRKFRAMSGARPLRLKYSDAAEMLAQQPVCANRDRTQRSKIRGHSITASASASSLCGTSRPSALAVVPACDLP
jgi:hypothetical protein